MEISYEQALVRLNTAKSNFNNGGQTSAYYAALTSELDSITKMFRSLPSSHVVKAQIEVCESYRKMCEENRIHYQNEENEQNYRGALDRLSIAEQKITAKKQSAEDFTELSKEFADIKQVFTSLPSSFDVKVQVEECVNYQEECDAKPLRKAEAEKHKEAMKPFVKKTTGIVLGVIIGAIPCILFTANGYPIIADYRYYRSVSLSGMLDILCIITGLLGGIVCTKWDGAKNGAIAGIIAGVVMGFGSCLTPASWHGDYDNPFMVFMPIVFGVCGLIIGAISRAINDKINS